jgi:pilus assembly protein TadC
MTVATVLLAAAVALLSSVPRMRALARTAPAQPPPPRRRDRPSSSNDPLGAAFALEMIAACLRCGMSVSAAAAAVAPSAPPAMGATLRRAADLLALGADPVTAWADPQQAPDPRTEALTRLARRSASSGIALAQGVTELAMQFRDDAADTARAAAERASVLIAGPLGVCYLPAFVCLGIVPVVVGLAGDVLRSGVW